MTHPTTANETPEDTVARLSLPEKATLATGATWWTTEDVPHAGIPGIRLSDGPHGLRLQNEDRADHLGINGSAPATCFPPAVTLAGSWDTDLAERVGQALGRESLAHGVHVLLGPGINIKRSPLCGRNFEYFSEDPLLSGVLGTAWVNGLQSQGIGASLKHFAANNQENGRMSVSADIDPRTLREIYLPAFRRVVTEAKPWTVMCAYNRLNGVHSSENPWLLTDLLRGEWGYEGVVVSDWGAVIDRARALAAGLDLEMPSSSGQGPTRLVAAVGSGELDEKVLDRSAARIVELARKATAQARADTSFDIDEHHALAREVAVRGAVLLKNDGRLLPITPTAGSRIAVLGEFARTPATRARAAHASRRPGSTTHSPLSLPPHRRRHSTSHPASPSTTRTATRPLCARKPWTSHAKPTWPSSSSAFRRASSPRATTANTSTSPWSKSNCLPQSRKSTRTRSSSLPTAASSVSPAGSTPSRPSWKAGCSARQAARPPLTCCSATPIRRAG